MFAAASFPIFAYDAHIWGCISSIFKTRKIGNILGLINVFSKQIWPQTQKEEIDYIFWKVDGNMDIMIRLGLQK